MPESAHPVAAHTGLLARARTSLTAILPGEVKARRRLRAERRKADEELLQSEWISPFLAWRANEVVARENRVELARSLRDVVASAEARYLPTASPVDRAAVRGDASRMLAIARRLEGPAPVAPRGVLLVEQLLVDGSSPLYASDRRDTLRSYLDSARDALEPR